MMTRAQCPICGRKAVQDSTGITIPHGQGCRYFIRVVGLRGAKRNAPRP